MRRIPLEQSEESSVKSRSRSMARKYRGRGNSTIIEEDLSMKDVSEEESVKPTKRSKAKKNYQEEEASVLDEEFSDDEEDFDTVSKVLRPSGV